MGRAVLALPIFSGILFGSVGVFVRTLTAAGLSNVTIMFVRALFASIMLAIFIFVKNIGAEKRAFSVELTAIPWIFCCGIFGMMATSMLFNISSVELSLALAAILLSIAPVYTMMMARVFMKTPITAFRILCCVMTIAGCVLVSGVLTSSAVLSGIGLAAGILSGVTYGLLTMFSGKAAATGTSSITITFYCLLIITIVLMPFADHTAVAEFINADAVKNICILLLHSLCVAVLPYVFLTTALRTVDPGKVSILASCEPVAAMVFGAIFYAEVPTVFSILGLAITVVALALLVKE